MPATAYLLVKPLGVVSHMNRNFPHSIGFLQKYDSGLCACGGVKATPAWTIAWERPESCTIVLIWQRVQRGKVNGICASLGRIEAGHRTDGGRAAWSHPLCVQASQSRPRRLVPQASPEDKAPLAVLLPPRVLSRDSTNARNSPSSPMLGQTARHRAMPCRGAGCNLDLLQTALQSFEKGIL